MLVPPPLKAFIIKLVRRGVGEERGRRENLESNILLFPFSLSFSLLSLFLSENEDEQVTRRYTSNITVFNNSYKIFEALTSQIGLCSTQQQQQSQQQHQEGQYDTDNYKRRKERSQRQPNEPQQQKIQQKQKPQQPQQPQPQQPQETQQPQRQEEAEQRRQRNKQKRRQYSKMAQESRGKKKKRGGRRGWGNEREAMGENIDGYYSS